MERRITIKKSTKLLLVVVLVLLVVSFTQFTFTKFEGNDSVGTPEEAVRQYLKDQDIPDLQEIEWNPKNRAEDGGGYFVVGKYPDHHYQIFFASFDQSSWHVWDLAGVREDETFLVNSGNPVNRDGNMENWGWGFVWSSKIPTAKAVVGFVRMVQGQEAEPIPFSLTQVGSLPLWVHKFPNNIGGIDYLKAYSDLGKEIWRFPENPS